MSEDNKRVVLIAAPPSMGKSHSLFKFANDPSVAYLNTDLKDLPFKVPKGGMKVLNIAHAKTALEAVKDLEANYPEVTTGVLDTVTFLMNRYEAEFVTGDTRPFGAAWQEYAAFYNDFMLAIKTSLKSWIILAHTNTVFKEAEVAYETTVPVRGAVGRIGVEADYNIILTANKKTLEKLEPFMEGNSLLTISAREKRLGFKYVFQTDLTSDTLDLKIRSPMGLWKDEELFIDNNISLVVQRLAEYYQ